MSDLTSSVLTDPEHESQEDGALLHLLDGYYIKRHTVNPWNTSGGYCDVFTGDHPTFGKVALKRPRGDQCTESQLRNFRQEARIWKGLRHPNILLFVGMIDKPSHIWLISVFAENGSLHEYTRKHQEADRHSLVFQFTSGLEYLHSQGVVHGDLKSDNLLISAKHELLIADFGLSKFTGTATSMSKKGVGSLQWMAPELLDEEDSTKTFSTDIYAYGITISEILCGEVPFKQYRTHVGVIKAVMQNKRPSKTPHESPQGKSYSTLWDAAEACWDPAPSKRPSMANVCIRFSLKCNGLPSIVMHGGESNQVSGQVEETPIRSETALLFSHIDSHSQVLKPITHSNDAGDVRLLQLLGNADHGDIGHMKDDGLCLEGTRVEVLRNLDAWADEESSARVKLLKGQAGRGKSTIARSVCSRFRKRWGDNASSGIFHFRRNNEALNKRPVIALARQLASSGDPRMRAAVLEAVRDHEDIVELRLEEQFEILLLQPFKASEPSSPRTLLVIDALDECPDHSLISSLLYLIHKHAPSLPSTVKFLLTSRPEDHIVRPFNASFDGIQENLDIVDETIIDDDIRSYLTARLSKIQQDFDLDAAWVSSEDISKLVRRTQGLFQWAHAAVEYVRERPLPNLRRLVQSPTLVLGLPALYQEILSTAFPQRKGVKDDANLAALIQHVIGSLVVADRPISPVALEYLWDDDSDRASCSDPSVEISEDILGRLGSMLVLPSTPNGPISFMHASVRDFFTDPDQCEDTRFLITPATHHARLADICFRRMERDLKHDICGIKDPSKMNAEVLDLVEQHIPSGLRYCCRSWSSHLSEIEDDVKVELNNVQKSLNEFCTRRLLHWLEVLSLIGAVLEVFDMTRQAKSWLEKRKAHLSEADGQTTTLLDDTYDFCGQFYRLISANSQHIRLSFLLHFPNDTALRRLYTTGQQVFRIIRGPPTRRPDRFRVINTGCEVHCVAVSPDGKFLASGLKDHTIYLWDLDIGEPKGKPLIGHTNLVLSVAFAPDSKTLASASWDKTIRLWDLDTGRPKGLPLLGHTNFVWSIAFAPDGKTLASGSSDNTIRLWNVDTGEPKGKALIGHSKSVVSVIFTPDGNILTSASYDGTIRLWDITTGELKGKPLVGHTDLILSIAFAPDGKVLASASYDKTVRLWDITTGNPKGKPLVGHSGWVLSVAFAPDGKTLASASWDKTIRLWDLHTGRPKGKPLVGHTGLVLGIAFTPNGKTLASASYDGTIRLWDIVTRVMGRPLIGHTGWIWSVAFTSKGNILASGSYDETIRLWDIVTGKQKGKTLVGHTNSVESVAFSPDGNTLASGSGDETIRLWDVVTEKEKRGPLIDHTGWVNSVSFAPDGTTLISTSIKETIHWRLRDGWPMRMEAHPHRDDIADNMRLDPFVRLEGEAEEPHEQGWVFIGGQRCFWLPSDFYMDTNWLNKSAQVEITLFRKFLVLHHHNIHILDVSAFL